MRKEYLILLVIIFFGAFLRLWQLDAIPSGVHSDEADTGYSAYSILKTGFSQYGTFNPLAIQEFNGGTHPPIYTYALIPLVKFFGLNIFIERFPSAIFGILSILIIFFLVKKLTSSNSVSLVASFLMAVNPWSIHISRQGLLEAIAVFFVTLGILLFLYGKEKKYMYILSAFVFGVSLHAYDAPKIFVPLFIIVLILYQRKDFFKVKKIFFSFIFLFLIFFLLTMKTLFLDKQINDYNQVSLIDMSQISRVVNEERTNTLAPLWLSSIFHNKITIVVKGITTGYFDIFNLNWLFINGHGNLQQAVGNHGEFNFFELPFFFIGLILLFQKKKSVAFFLLAWLLIAAIPGGITRGNFPYRSVLVLPVPIIFSSFGIILFWQWSKKYTFLLSHLMRVSLIFIALFSVSSYLLTYFFDYPVYASNWWFKQRNESLDYLVSAESKYDKIYVVGGIEWPIIYAFRNKINPQDFQNSYKNFVTTNSTIFNIGKFTFTDVRISKKISPTIYFPSGSLVLADAETFRVKPIKEFFGPNPLSPIYEIYLIEKNSN